MRVKTGTVRHRKHKKVLDSVKGSWQGNNRRIKLAKQVELHAGEYAFAGRKRRKRDFRSLWIQRINAASRNLGMDYRELMHAFKKANISLNRKMLAELAVNHTDIFAQVVAKVR